MRVALVCPYDWSVPGGVQAHVAGLAAAFRRGGVATDVVAPASGPPGEAGVIAVGRPLPIPDNGSVARVALDPVTVLRVVRLVRSGRWDLLHLHEPLVPAVCLTAVLAAPLPVVGTFHRYGPGAGWYRRFAFVTRPAMRRIDARIAVSRAAADHVARTFPGRFRIIPNGLDVAAHALPAERHGTRIVFVGRSEPRKGLAVLLAAFAHLPDGVHLDLVGVRPQELRRLASRLPPEVARRVHAHGRVGDEERRRLLAEADVLCAPSLRGESFGIVLAEGMAAGLPVVASAIPGYIDLVSEEWGRLVPPGDERALAAALAQILADRSLREALGAAGRREAQRLDWSRVAGEVLAVYEEVLGLRRAAPGPVPAG